MAYDFEVKIKILFPPFFSTFVPPGQIQYFEYGAGH
jgi:hypothetical protein